jgi:Zn finger protein HypA/HybF involved in hydrogenase expression
MKQNCEKCQSPIKVLKHSIICKCGRKLKTVKKGA